MPGPVGVVAPGPAFALRTWNFTVILCPATADFGAEVMVVLVGTSTVPIWMPADPLTATQRFVVGQDTAVADRPAGAQPVLAGFVESKHVPRAVGGQAEDAAGAGHPGESRELGQRDRFPGRCRPGGRVGGIGEPVDRAGDTELSARAGNIARQ